VTLNLDSEEGDFAADQNAVAWVEVAAVEESMSRREDNDGNDDCLRWREGEERRRSVCLSSISHHCLPECFLE
jgi:hypothetical protein